MKNFVTKVKGSTRTAFIIGNLVFKVPVYQGTALNFIKGLLANAIEVKLYKSSKNKELYAPIHFSLPLGLLVVAAKVDVGVSDLTLASYYEKLALTGDTTVTRFSGLRPTDIGTYKGNPVVFDYGSLREPGDEVEIVNELYKDAMG